MLLSKSTRDPGVRRHCRPLDAARLGTGQSFDWKAPKFVS
jgi:hypothetical protein